VRVSPRWRRWFYGVLQIFLALIVFSVSFTVIVINRFITARWIVMTLFAIMAFIPACIVGLEYRLAPELSRQSRQHTIASNYSADMYGSAMGAFAGALLLIPSFGIAGTGVFLAALNVVTAILVILVYRRG
jgi:predicted membrane-bound spermidine synthase